jgi:hypothetical protein
VTGSFDTDERLRDAFRALASTSSTRCSDEDLDRVWRAVAGDLPLNERHELIERLASDPACAEAWRVALELQQPEGERQPALVSIRSRMWNPAWIGLAAALVLAVGVGLFQVQRAPESTFRNDAAYVIESRLSSDASLPRDAFVLRWSAGPEGSRYKVRVTTEDLRVITTENDVRAPEFRVAPDALSAVAPGSRIFWQVTASLPSGEAVSSQTFVVRTQ